jgi:hypothetical protein
VRDRVLQLLTDAELCLPGDPRGWRDAYVAAGEMSDAEPPTRARLLAWVEHAATAGIPAAERVRCLRRAVAMARALGDVPLAADVALRLFEEARLSGALGDAAADLEVVHRDPATPADLRVRIGRALAAAKTSARTRKSPREKREARAKRALQGPVNRWASGVQRVVDRWVREAKSDREYAIDVFAFARDLRRMGGDRAKAATPDAIEDVLEEPHHAEYVLTFCFGAIDAQERLAAIALLLADPFENPMDNLERLEEILEPTPATELS